MKKVEGFSERKFFLIAVLALSVFITGCSSVRRGVTWPSVEVVTVNGEQSIYVAYQDRVEIVDPVLGTAIPLRNPQNDEVRVDDEGKARPWILRGNDFDSAQFFASPIQLNDEELLVPDYNQRLLQIDLVTARPVNTVGIPVAGHVIADIVSQDGVYYIPIMSGQLIAMEQETKEVLWTFSVEEDIWASPLVVSGTVYITSLDHFLYALNAETGEQLWSLDLEGGIPATPAYRDGHLYVGSLSHKVYDISVDGEILASYEGKNWIWSTPTLVDDVLYVSDLSGWVHALDITANLAVIWSTEVDAEGIRPAPLVTEEFVIVATRKGKVYWLSWQGGLAQIERTIEGEPEILSDLVLLEPSETLDINEAMVIVSTTDNKRLLASFSLDNGLPNWVYGR